MASELEIKMSRLDIRCDHLAGITGRLPKATTDSLIQQVREVITEFYAEERKKNHEQACATLRAAATVIREWKDTEESLALRVEHLADQIERPSISDVVPVTPS